MGLVSIWPYRTARAFGLTGVGHRVNGALEERWRDVFDGYVTGPVGEPAGPDVSV